MTTNIRIGEGFDIHPLVENLPLTLAGIKIPHNKGLLGHSDADILIHATIDALLGALALGDIGSFFPDDDIKYKDIDSSKLLKKIVDIINNHGFSINNLDSTIIIEKPKLKDYLHSMRQNLAQNLNISINKVSIKAKTNEKFDSIGQEDSAVARVIVLLMKD